MSYHVQSANDLLPAGYAGADFQTEEELSLPGHLAQLPGSLWGLWRWVGLRGAGFPAVYVRRLADADCAAAAEQVLQAEEAAQQALNEALEALNEALDALRRDQDWDNTIKRDPLVKALRQLKQGKLPGPLDAARAATAVEACRAARACVDAAWAHFHQVFGAGEARLSQAIQELARIDRFQEAVIWQNRHAFHNGIGVLLRKQLETTARGSKQRQYEELVANYVQRYCVKNDTIGFFGPVGWAQIVDQDEALQARPAPRLLAERTVYFEGWCIDALARTLAENKALQPWLAPRRIPFIHVDGTTLYTPFEAASTLPAEQAALLYACNGTQTAQEIAAELIQMPSSGLKSEAEVYNLLEQLISRSLITWTIELPFESHPERTLQRLLERIGDEQLRRESLGALAALEAARTAVAHAGGAAGRLDEALKQLEATFTHLTGAAATRAAGKMYAGRTLVYEDCRRDIEVEIGPPLLQALGPPLALLLASARWFTFQVATSYRDTFQELYAELARQAGAPTVNLVNFWLRVQPLLFEETTRLVDDIAPMLSERWSDILAVPADRHRVEYSSEELRPHVLAAFDAPGAGWKSACYHSPDVLVSASSIEALKRGDYQLVMGELHLATNTLSASFFVAQHPYPEDLFLALEIDLPEPRLVPVISRYWNKVTVRTRPALVSPDDFRLVLAPDSAGVPKSRAVPIGALVVEQADGELVVRTRDGRLCFDLIETFSSILSVLAVNAFRILPPSPHTPRVTFDRLVVCRESWRFAPAEIRFAFEKSASDRFIAARRWARAQGMPRYVFVKVPVEVKPFYVDFDSPIYVDIFAKMLRRTMEHNQAEPQVVVTEMLPSLDQTWLPDAEGQQYTSELRFVAVDLAP